MNYPAWFATKNDERPLPFVRAERKAHVTPILAITAPIAIILSAGPLELNIPHPPENFRPDCFVKCHLPPHPAEYADRHIGEKQDNARNDAIGRAILYGFLHGFKISIVFW